MIARLVSATVVSCLLAGVLLLSVPVALAATPPVIEEASVSNVAGTSATLQARVDPEGSETTYRFEYGTSVEYGTSIPIPDGLVGSGSVGVAVSTHPQDLTPSTTYHYRVVALVASRSETVPGSDGTFTTQPAGSEFALPDGRQWELVSPPNKHGALIRSLAEIGPTQAAEDGSVITYGANVPTEAEPPGNGYLNYGQVLSVRGAQGWSSRDIATPHDSATSARQLLEYPLFSSDLSFGLASPGALDATLLSDRASEPTPYIRRESLCDTPASASECYLPLVTGKEGFADVPPGTKFGPSGGGSLFEKVIFEGASPDFRHVALRSDVALTTTPIAASQIYEWSADASPTEPFQLVSILPASEGGGQSSNAQIGLAPASTPTSARHSISDDGSRIFWEERAGEGHQLYLRDTAKQETLRLDVQQPGVAPGGTPYALFRIASRDGSKVFFTDYDQEQRLTARSGAQGQDLYECEIVEEAGKLKCKLADLTPEIGGQSADVQNMPLGASEDGSFVYFVANGVLGDGAERGATQGNCKINAPSSARCNLYEYHDGATTFIATLSSDDEFDWGEGYWSVGRVTSRVSPDGRYLTFMSDRSLTGYDNRDATSGKPDAEVYLYDAVSKRLVCASCNPTGSRPVGVEVANFSTSGKEPRANIVSVAQGYGSTFDSEKWIAANLPQASGAGYSAALYQPRLLADGGRMFFNSSDALVPQDVNGREDVYEFEPDGTGGCTVSSATFSQSSGGCVSLISSGTAPEDSAFMDASEGGRDVFLMTSSRLTAQDYDTAYDIYDAHECSVSVPCVAPAVSSPPCSSGDSCKAAPSPQPSIFGAPASATFAGAGNVAASPSAPGVKSRSLTRARKLAGALKQCRKKPKRKRAGCEKQAKKRYGAKKAANAAGTMRKAQG